MTKTLVKWWHGECQHRIQLVEGQVVHDTREPGGGWARRDEWLVSDWDEVEAGDGICKVPSDDMEAQL